MLATARLTGQSAGAVLLGLIFSLRGVGEGGAGLALGLASGLAAAAAPLQAAIPRSAAPSQRCGPW